MQIDLDQLIKRVGQVKEQVNSEFGALTTEQLNFRNSDQSWSIGECIHHLIIINQCYFDEFDMGLVPGYKNSFWKRINPFTRSIGKTMTQTLGPEKPKTFKTPRLFKPAKSDTDSNLLKQFDDNQNQLIVYLEKFKDIDNRIIINSPVSTVITLDLEDAVQIIVGHEERHINQALEVYSASKFPKNE